MTVRVYRWDDASAPTLSGAAGALISVLDACLVNGYGSKAAAGWTKPYTGTNLAAFRQGAGNMMYLRVGNASAATSAYCTGYETMSDVNTGTGMFPTTGQLASGGLWRTSNSADSTARPWVIIATDKTFYMWNAHNNTSATSIDSCSGNAAIQSFGDFVSDKSGDAYATCLNCSAGFDNGYSQTAMGYTSPTTGTFSYLARSYTQIGVSVPAGKMSPLSFGSAAGYSGSFGAAYPDPITGGILLAPIFVTEGNYIVRGALPGMWFVGHNLTGGANGGDTFNGSGDLSGKSFMLLKTSYVGASTLSFVAVEISDTW